MKTSTTKNDIAIVSDHHFTENLRRYQLLSAVTQEGIWEYNYEEGAVYYNQGMIDLFGFTMTEMADNRAWWENNIHPQDKKRILTSLDNLLAGRENVWWGKYRFLCSNGNYKLVLDRLFIERDSMHKPVKLTGTMQDFEQLQEIKEELDGLQAEHRKQTYRAVLLADEENKRYLSNVLNEHINQILTTIQMHIAQARQYIQPSGEQWLTKASTMLLESIKGIRDIAHQLSPASLQLLGLKESIDHLMQFLADTKGVETVVEMDEATLQSLPAEQVTNLYRIVQMQVENIMQHSNAERVEVKLFKKAGHTTLIIKDDGIGKNLKHLKYGHGFSGIEQRTENFNGSFSLKSKEGVSGFMLTVKI